MLGGGWRSRTWGAPRGPTVLIVAVGALQVTGATPALARDYTVAPAGATLQIVGQEVTLPAGQPAVRWSGLTVRGRWVRTWGPHPTHGTTNRRARVSWASLETPTADATLRISWAAFEVPHPGMTPKLVGLHRSGLSSFIGKQVWGPSSGGYLEVGRDIPPGLVQIVGLAPRAVVDASANARTLRVSWAEFETPNPDRRARVSWAALETPDGPTRARISWAALDLPNAPRTVRVSWAALEVPDVSLVPTDRRALVSWAELQVPQPLNLTAARASTRTWVIPRESRTWVVPAHSRTWSVR